jgi:hypothetical protein
MSFFARLKTLQPILSVLTEEDFHKRDTDTPITITLFFSDLSEEAQNDFSAYYRQGELIISARAEFDARTDQAHVRQFGNRTLVYLGVNRPLGPVLKSLKYLVNAAGSAPVNSRRSIPTCVFRRHCSRAAQATPPSGRVLPVRELRRSPGLACGGWRGQSRRSR